MSKRKQGVSQHLIPVAKAYNCPYCNRGFDDAVLGTKHAALYCPKKTSPNNTKEEPHHE